MGRFTRKDKSKSALGRITQANDVIETLKNTTVGDLVESISILNTNYQMLSLSVSNISNTQLTINGSIESITERITGIETSQSTMSQSIESINQEITNLLERIIALEAS